jgi:hypothetical protein
MESSVADIANVVEGSSGQSGQSGQLGQLGQREGVREFASCPRLRVQGFVPGTHEPDNIGNLRVHFHHNATHPNGEPGLTMASI